MQRLLVPVSSFLNCECRVKHKAVTGPSFLAGYVASVISLSYSLSMIVPMSISYAPFGYKQM